VYTHGRRKPVNEPRHDDERLAALLDGRLKGPERDELLAYLAAADEDYHVLVETAAILREVEEQDTRALREGTPAALVVEGAQGPLAVESLPPSLTQRAGGWRRVPRRIALPALLAGLVVLGFFAFRGRAGAAGDPVGLAGQLAQVTLPADVDGHFPWGIRSAGATAAPSDESAAQAGAMLALLAVAVEAGDAKATTRLVQQIRTGYDLRGEDLKRVEQRAGDAPDALEPLLKRATGRLETLLDRGGGDQDRGYLRLGAWTEAARLAARHQDRAFFATGDSREMLRRAGNLTQGDDAAVAALARVRAALGEPPRWAALAPALDDLLRALTN
jgi:hypothetical protein